MEFNKADYVPSKRATYLKEFIGLKLSKVERLFPKHSYDFNEHFSELDGPFVLTFDNGKVLCIDSSPELEDSLLIFEGIPSHMNLEAFDKVDCTDQIYWKNKIGIAVGEIKIVKINGLEIALQIKLASSYSFYIYVWNDDLISVNDLPRIADRKIEFLSLDDV